MCVQYNAYGSVTADDQTDGYYWPLHCCVSDVQCCSIFYWKISYVI